MYEVEMKVRADQDRVRERLGNEDATHLETVQQTDTYYNAPDRDFASTDEALRIREESPEGGPDRSLLTYKGPLVDTASKTRQEAETGVTDRKAMRAILDGLGYEAAATVRKEREHYELDDCTVTLDSVENLGEFVEVEIETHEEIEQGDSAAGERLETLRGQAIEVLETLGLDPDQQIRTSYLGLSLSTEN